MSAAPRMRHRPAGVAAYSALTLEVQIGVDTDTEPDTEGVDGPVSPPISSSRSPRLTPPRPPFDTYPRVGERGLMNERRQVLAEGFCFLEGPRWHEGRLFVSDMHADRVVAVDEEGRVEVVLDVPERPSGLGWLPDGRMLVVSMVNRQLLRCDPDGVRVHADLHGIATYHCNDMVVDAVGRAYVGNFGFDWEVRETPQPAALALVYPDGRVVRAAAGLSFPNGTVITPDGGTLIVAESFGACLTAFDIAADGTLVNRRVWASLDGVGPDGICLDAEGAVWVASPLSYEIVRVRQGGVVSHSIKFEQHPVACMLGGDGRRTLFVLTAPSLEREACRTARGARIETMRVDVPGAGWP